MRDESRGVDKAASTRMQTALVQPFAVMSIRCEAIKVCTGVQHGVSISRHHMYKSLQALQSTVPYQKPPGSPIYSAATTAVKYRASGYITSLQSPANLTPFNPPPPYAAWLTAHIVSWVARWPIPCQLWHTCTLALAACIHSRSSPTRPTACQCTLGAL